MGWGGSDLCSSIILSFSSIFLSLSSASLRSFKILSFSSRRLCSAVRLRSSSLRSSSSRWTSETGNKENVRYILIKALTAFPSVQQTQWMHVAGCMLYVCCSVNKMEAGVLPLHVPRRTLCLSVSSPLLHLFFCSLSPVRTLYQSHSSNWFNLLEHTRKNKHLYDTAQVSFMSICLHLVAMWCIACILPRAPPFQQTWSFFSPTVREPGPVPCRALL